jgi:hypothetical protein
MDHLEMKFYVSALVTSRLRLRLRLLLACCKAALQEMQAVLNVRDPSGLAYFPSPVLTDFLMFSSLQASLDNMLSLTLATCLAKTCLLTFGERAKSLGGFRHSRWQTLIL